MRKLGIVSLTGLIFISAFGLAPQAAPAADPGCNGYTLPKGIYPPSDPTADNKGHFDLTFSPRTKATTTQMTLKAMLCGANPTAGALYKTGYETFPGKGEKVKCGRPNPTTAACGSPIVNMPDRTFIGNATLDVWRQVTGSYDNWAAKIYVRYNLWVSGGGNDCASTSGYTLIMCFNIEGVLGNPAGDTCTAHGLIRKVTSSGKYEMKVFQPRSCGTQATYISNVDKIAFCRYHGGLSGQIDGNACNSSDSTRWIFKTGTTTSSYTYTLKYYLSDSTSVSGTAIGNWT